MALRNLHREAGRGANGDSKQASNVISETEDSQNSASGVRTTTTTTVTTTELRTETQTRPVFCPLHYSVALLPLSLVVTAPDHCAGMERLCNSLPVLLLDNEIEIIKMPQFMFVPAKNVIIN